MKPLLCFDLDNTLYQPEKTDLLKIIDQNIIAFIRKKLGYSTEQIRHLRRNYSKQYGSTLLGLVKTEGINPEDYLKYIHNLDDNYLPVRDEKLAKIFAGIKCNKIIITNSYKKYALRILDRLGIKDEFSRVFDVLDMRLLYKKYALPYKLILGQMNTSPKNAIMFDDIWTFLLSAKGVGMTTVLVNSEVGEARPDFYLKEIYQISTVLQRLNIENT